MTKRTASILSIFIVAVCIITPTIVNVRIVPRVERVRPDDPGSPSVVISTTEERNMGYPYGLLGLGLVQIYIIWKLRSLSIKTENQK
jgi:hypothetical protein